MDRNRQFRIISALLFICLSIETTIGSAKPSAANRTDGLTPAKQSPRTTTIGSSALHAFDERNDKNSDFSQKTSPKSDVISDTNTYQDEDSDSNSGDHQEWDGSLLFDPKFLATLNSTIHRSIDAMIEASLTDSQTKHSMPSSSPSFSPSSSPSTSSGSSSPENTYHSPENYGKTFHKNNKTDSCAYLYPSSSSTTTSTTTSTTPTPETSHNRFEGLSGGSSSKSYSKSVPLYPSNYNPNRKHQTPNYNNNKSSERPQTQPLMDYYDYDLQREQQDYNENPMDYQSSDDRNVFSYNPPSIAAKQSQPYNPKKYNQPQHRPNYIQQYAKYNNYGNNGGHGSRYGGQQLQSRYVLPAMRPPLNRFHGPRRQLERHAGRPYMNNRERQRYRVRRIVPQQRQNQMRRRQQLMSFG